MARLNCPLYISYSRHPAIQPQKYNTTAMLPAPVVLLLLVVVALPALANRRHAAAAAADLPQLLQSPLPYEFPPLGDARGRFPMPPCHGVPVFEITIAQLQAAFAARKLTCAQLVQCYTRRILQTNDYLSYPPPPPPPPPRPWLMAARQGR